MSIHQRTKYDAEFKRNAVRLSDEPGRTVIEVAHNLGIAKDVLYRWRREYRLQQGLAFSGKGWGALTAKERKIKNLEKWVHEAEMMRDL